MTDVRVAFIGAGKMGREHVRAFRDVPGVTLAGIYSRTRAKAEALAAEFGIERVCDSIEELHETTRASLAVVAVNVLDVAPTAHAALAYPWTLLLEKPAGIDLDEAEALATAARSRGNVYVALNRRMLSSTLAAAEDLESREEKRFIHVFDQQDQLAAAAAHPPRVVTNWMFANSIHLVDYLRCFGRGAVTSVTPVVPWQPESPGIVVANVTFDSGDVGMYEGVWRGPAPWAVTVQTPSTRWELRPLERASMRRRGDATVHDVDVDAFDRDFKPGFRRQAAEAVAAVRGEATRLADLETALESMRLVHAIFGGARR
jgi:predicted dehydrogenase